MTARNGAKSGFIAAKLAPPQLAYPLIERGLMTLDPGLLACSRLVLLQAPAGYGKTTWMVGQWRALRSRGIRTAWLTLDSDDDPGSLFRYLTAAVLGVDRDTPGNDLGLTPSAPAAVPTLMHALRQSAEPIVIFLDDVESLVDAAALADLENLMERLPPQHTLIIATRSKPELRLARYRVRGEIVDIGAAELGFASEDVARYLRDAGLTWLDDDAVQRIFARTEGWPVAVQLASRFLRRAGDVDDLLAELAGPVRDLYDYLTEEIFSRQSESLRSFLLETSVLRDLHPHLCDVVLGRNDSQLILQELLDRNLFVTQLGAEGWLRFHSLFREMLGQQLMRTDGSKVSALHKRAAAALADMELYNQAIGHAIACSDPSFIMEFIAGPGRLAIQRGAAVRISTWAKQQPLPVLARQAGVLVVTAWAHMLARDVERSNIELEMLRQQRTAGALSDAEGRSLATLETMFAMMTYDFEGGLTFSRQHLVDISSNSPFERGVIANVTGYAEVLLGRFDDARGHLSDGLANHVAAGSSFGQAFSYCYRGLLEAVQGQFSAALRMYAQADEIDPGQTESPSRAVVDAFAADVLLEQNYLAEARAKIRSSLLLAEEFAYCGIVSLSHLTMARLLAAEGNHEAAARFTDDAVEEGLRRNFPRLVYALQWERVRLALLFEDVAEAGRHAARIVTPVPTAVGHAALLYPEELDASDIGLLRLRVHQGAYDEVLVAIEPALKHADGMRRVWRANKLRVLRCLALAGRGDGKTALRRMYKLLESTQRERFMRCYLDEGSAAISLLRAVREQFGAGVVDHRNAGLVAYLDNLLQREPPSPTLREVTTEALTEREQAIVSCLMQGLTNKQMSDRLFLSENTVKWHLRKIYEKLGVRSRTGALAAYRALNPS